MSVLKRFDFIAAGLERYKKIAGLVLIGLSLHMSVCRAEGLVLESVDFSILSGDNLQLLLDLSGPASEPRIFHTENPARIALDLPGVTSGLEQKTVPINIGGAQSVQAVESAGRTRVVINLTNMMPYTSKVDGDKILITLQSGNAPMAAANAAPAKPSFIDRPFGGSDRHIENIDFRRGEKGEGRLIVTLSDPKSLVDIHEEGQKVIVRFAETSLPPRLARRLDVLDFATPVRSIDATPEGSHARMVVATVSGEYDYSSYQTDNILTVEFRPLTKAEKEEIKKKNFAYSGDKLTLNFQDIPVRSVLQILADFTNLNIVASDTVQGNVTLRLNDVPWDQALELVLKSKGLGKRQEGNIIRVAPLEEINKQEKEELEAQKVVEDLEPLRTEIIQINYTKAEDIKKVLVGTTERISQSSSDPAGIGGTTASTAISTLDVSQSVLSGRGNVTVDPRTNQLIVKDTARNLERVRDLVRQLDKPIRQVLIESRIVIARNEFLRDLGSRLQVNRLVNARGAEGFGSGGGNRDLIFFPPASGGEKSTKTDVLVDLAANGAATAASGGASALGFTLIKAGDYLLDLELSAAQREGRAETVSNPRLITSDQSKAVIKQGVEIPYQTTVVAGGGQAANITFKQAVLELNVTPHITPDDQVLMELFIRKDEQGVDTPRGPAIDKREIETTAQVANGETVVLGGVYEGVNINNTDKVPFFGDLPGIGYMFRRNSVEDTKRELLVFITPKILKQDLSLR
ncbi:fimbrial assembly protein PilQ [Methylocaldum marinum]|uniref:Fimbrial assembly protein PilQ n=1 Tax=Methylocaldum marinum TaxID=1432792 RepID=A0A250L1G0_9GAMM|nr:type IV pilus secretin PilQ [Methylocaldum marinum]BBA37241.1 fimbrial assembly protein PilQ [Methylocaldum marinum]